MQKNGAANNGTLRGLSPDPATGAALIRSDVFLRALLAVAAGLSMAHPLSADPAMECESAGSQVEIGACVAETAERVDSAVEMALRLAWASAEDLDTSTGRLIMGPALDASQEAWIAYRDAQCEAVGILFGGGSGTGIAMTACRIDLGRARVTELLRFAQ